MIDLSPFSNCLSAQKHACRLQFPIHQINVLWSQQQTMTHPWSAKMILFCNHQKMSSSPRHQLTIPPSILRITPLPPPPHHSPPRPSRNAVVVSNPSTPFAKSSARRPATPPTTLLTPPPPPPPEQTTSSASSI